MLGRFRDATLLFGRTACERQQQSDEGKYSWYLFSIILLLFKASTVDGESSAACHGIIDD